MQRISISAPSTDLLVWKHPEPLNNARCEVSVSTYCEAVLLLKREPWEEVLPDGDIATFNTRDIESVYGVRMQPINRISWAMGSIPSIDENNASCTLGGGGQLFFCIQHSRELVRAMAGINSTGKEIVEKILSGCIKTSARKHLSRVDFASLDYNYLSKNIFVDMSSEFEAFGLGLERVVVDRVIRVQ